MSVTALIRAMDSLKKREGDLPPTLKTVFFEGLKHKYKRKTIKEVLLSYKGGSWGNDYFSGCVNAKVLRSPDIRFGFIDIKNAEERYFTQKEFENFSLKNNDILVIKSNGSLDLVGKSQIYKVDNEYLNVIASNFLMVLSPNEAVVYPEYLDLFLKSPESLVWRFDTQKTTTGLRNLNSTEFLNIEIPVPDTIEEQINLYESFNLFLKGDIYKDEIEIKKFYALSKTKEALSFELTYQLSLLKKLRQQLLQDAVQGKLVEQNKKDEPASELLKKIKAEKEKLIAEKKLKKEKELPPIKPEEIPFEIPENWVWCRLGEMVNLVTSGSRDWAKYYSSEGEIFLRMGNLSRDSYNLRMDKIQYVKPPKNQEGNRTRLEANDILISITGEVGNLGLIPEDFGKAYINQHTALVRLNKAIVVKYVCNLFLTRTLQVQFNAPQRGMKNSFRLSDIDYLLIPLPPFAEQNRIVQKLDELMQYCNELEASIKQSESQNSTLLQQVLREALSLPTNKAGK